MTLLPNYSRFVLPSWNWQHRKEKPWGRVFLPFAPFCVRKHRNEESTQPLREFSEGESGHFRPSPFRAVSLACARFSAMREWRPSRIGLHVLMLLYICFLVHVWNRWVYSRWVIERSTAQGPLALTVILWSASCSSLDVSFLCWKLLWKSNRMVGIFQFSIH